MPVPANIDEFLDLIRKSGVTDEVKLNAYLEKIQNSPIQRPEQPNKFASWLVRDGILTYFQAEQILQGKYKRFTIGKYKVLEKLGAGGMGQVFLCEHKMMRRRVAIKVLPIAKADDDSARERFYREARAVAALDHPNIVRAYDVDQDENLHFLVMEFVDGTNLHDLVRKHAPLAVDRACHYIYAAAAGLQYSNGMGIIHRDIKPGNLLVDRAGIVKVLDMGLAMFFKDEDESLTRKFDENVLGTADYLAPEQAIDSHNVDIRADIYSLGGTFYYLLTGSAPFAEGGIAQKLLMHQTREPKPIKGFRSDVPDAVIAIVAKMMKKSPDDRYRTPAELMAALAPFVQSPIAPPTEAEMPKLSRAAIGGATSTSAVGRAPASGTFLAGSASGMMPFAGASGSGAPVSQTSAVVDGPHTIPTAIWEDIAASSDTGTPASAVTASAPEKSDSAKRIRKSAPTESEDDEEVSPKKRKLLLIGGIAAAVVLVVGLGIFVFGGKSKKPVASEAPPPVITGPRTLFVTKGASQPPEATFPTLAAAIKAVNPGDTVQLLDDPHEEPPVRFSREPGKFNKVIIEAGNAAKMVRFKLPEGSIANTKHGVFDLIGTDGLTIRNLSIDAGNKLDYCISVSDKIDGLVLENLSLRGANDAGLVVREAIAAPERQARFEKLNFLVNQANCDGIQFRSGSRSTVSNVLVMNCRFAGKGYNAVHFFGPARAIELRNNRIYNFDNGIQFDGTDNSVQVKILHSTFHTLSTSALFMSNPPPTSPPCEIVFQQNYLAKTKEVLKGYSNKFPGLKAGDNVKDKDTKNGGTGVDPKTAELGNYTMPVPANLEDDATFLHIDDESPLGKGVGQNKVKAGAR